jgi:hypothetical protein
MSVHACDLLGTTTLLLTLLVTTWLLTAARFTSYDVQGLLVPSLLWSTENYTGMLLLLIAQVPGCCR